MLKKTFQAQDVDAIKRATSHSNHPDHEGQAIATPEMGTNKRQKGSARSAAGEGIPAGFHPAPKAKLHGVQAKAKAFTTRSENGNAEKTGGGN
jgi:hypothetical protein